MSSLRGLTTYNPTTDGWQCTSAMYVADTCGTGPISHNYTHNMRSSIHQLYSGLQNGCRDCHSTHDLPLNLYSTLAS